MAFRYQIKSVKRRVSSLLQVFFGHPVIKKFLVSDMPAYAGATSFFFMLSFFPFIMLLFSLLSVTPLTPDNLYDWLTGIVPNGLNALVQGFCEEYRDSGGNGVRITVALTALYLSSKAFVSIRQGLNAMYEIEEERNWFVIRLICAFFSLIFMILVVVVLGLLVFGNAILVFVNGYIPFLTGITERIVGLRYLITFPLMMLIFWSIYALLPHKRHRFRGQFFGAVLSAFGWTVFSALFSVFVDHWNNYGTIYGTMAAPALLMVWLYGCFYMLYLGGFVNSCLEQKLLPWKRRRQVDDMAAD